jgi:hypothetical protein
MSTLYASYSLVSEGERRCLAISLHDPSSDVPAGDRLRQLHEAADSWMEQHQEISLRTDLSDAPPENSVSVGLPEYLHAGGKVNGRRLQRHLGQLLTSGSLHRYAIRPGAPVEGADLVGREGLVTSILDLLGSGSCHLRAPRRYGKTSVLRRVEQKLMARRTPTVLVDLSPGRSPRWFFVTVASAVMDRPHTRQVAASLDELSAWPQHDCTPAARAAACKELASRISANPWRFGHYLLATLADAGVVLLLDELSVFLRAALSKQRSEAESLLLLLAELRRQQQLRMVLSGSAGLTSYVAFSGLTIHLQDVTPLDLPPLAREDAAGLSEELIYTTGSLPTPDAAEQVLAEVGEPVPYFVHALVNETCGSGRMETVNAALVRDAYRNRLLGPVGNFFFKLYRLRNQPYPAALLPAAASLLNELASHDDGCPLSELERAFIATAPDEHSGGLRLLLACLEEDYDLVESDGRWLMRCKVLRDRWSLSEAWLTGE